MNVIWHIITAIDLLLAIIYGVNYGYGNIREVYSAFSSSTFWSELRNTDVCKVLDILADVNTICLCQNYKFEATDLSDYCTRIT